VTIPVEDNGLGIDPQVTPCGHATVVRRSQPRGTTFTPLEGKWEQITDAADGKPCSLRPLFSGAATGVRTLVRTRWTVGP
jgi:hypothetical protein